MFVFSAQVVIIVLARATIKIQDLFPFGQAKVAESYGVFSTYGHGFCR